jgi:cation diffusion facilitator family transporter
MPTRAQKHIREGEIIARNSLFVLIFVASIKAAAGFATGMVVLLADALASVTDILSLFASYIGLKLSRQGKTKGFQYGYYKVETFMALVVSVMILYLGYKIIRESINRLADPSPGQYTLIGVAAVLISIGFSLRLAGKLTRAAEKANSISLMNNAKDKKMDVVSSVAVLAGIIANHFEIPYLEGTVGILISLIILKVGLYSAKEAVFFLLDYWDDYTLLHKIKKVLLKEGDLVKRVKKIRLRRAGTFIFGEAFLEVNPFADMKDLRNDLNKLGNKIKEVNEHIRDFSLFEMIPQPKKIRVAIPIIGNRGLKSQIAEKMGAMTHYVFVDIVNKKIKTHKVEKFTFRKKQDYIEIANLLKKKKVNILINSDLNSLLYYQLQHVHHIAIYPNFSNVDKVEDTLKLLLIDT